MEVETAVCAKLFRGETEQVRKVIEIKKEKGNEVKGGNYMLDQSYYQKTDEIIEHYGRKAASLIPIMQDIQAEYRYLPGELLTYVAKEIGVKEAKAYSVATFYENFSFEPKGKYVIKVCDGTACHVRKSMPEKEALMVSYKYLDTSKIKSSDVVGGANADGTYRGVNCLLAAQTEVSVQPRILIAPGFTHDQPDDDGETLANPVVSELLGIAERLKAVIIADCPDGSEQDEIKYQKCFGSARVYSVNPCVKIQY